MAARSAQRSVRARPHAAARRATTFPTGLENLWATLAPRGRVGRVWPARAEVHLHQRHWPASSSGRAQQHSRCGGVAPHCSPCALHACVRACVRVCVCACGWDTAREACGVTVLAAPSHLARQME